MRPLRVALMVLVLAQVFEPNFFMSGLKFATTIVPGAIIRGPGDDAGHNAQATRALEIAVHVAANPAFVSALAPEASPVSAAPVPRRADWRRWGPLAAVGIGLLIVSWLLRRYGPAYAAWRQARRRAHEESEAAYFARAEHACRGGDAPAAYRALAAWALRADARSITGWCAERGDAALSGQLAILEQAMFASGATNGAWDGPGFATALARARRAWLATRTGPNCPR